MNFDEARAAAFESAVEFIGFSTVTIVSAGFGGSESDDELCQKLAEQLDSVKPVKTATFEFVDEEEEDGEFVLSYYEINGFRFVDEYLEEGGPSRSDYTMHVPQDALPA